VCPDGWRSYASVQGQQQKTSKYDARLCSRVKLKYFLQMESELSVATEFEGETEEEG
jgi:hypothetical protein